MQLLRTAIGVSIALHAGAIVWLCSRPMEKHEPPKLVTIETVPSAPATPPPEDIPMAIELLDDNSVASAARTAPPAGRARHGKSEQGITTSRPTITETPAPKTQDDTNKRSLLTMRGPEPAPKQELHGPSTAFWNDFDANTKPLAPKDIASEQRADEIASAEGHLNNSRWIANASPEQVHAERERIVARRYEHSTRELQPDKDGGTKSDHKTFRAKFNPDGTVASLEDKPNIQREGFGASFDVTDGLMRSKGIDPYSSYKLKVLDETRDERAAIGKRYRTEQLAHSRQFMAQNVQQLWTTTRDPAARRQGLFELWDDCAETGTEELVAGGAAARTYLVGFIRSKLPAGSANAFTDDEIARFNKQRKSRAPFAPYES